EDAPNVVGLVYIAAFGLDQGESLGQLLSQGPVTPALAHLFTDSRGFGWLSEADFVEHFAADVDSTRAHVMYAVQQPLASSAFTDVMGDPAWKSLPSWYLVAQNDEAPDIPRFRNNTAAFVHEMPAASLSNVDGDVTYVRVQVLTNAGALDRDKQMAAVARLTAVVADVAGDPSLAERTWVLLTEAP